MWGIWLSSFNVFYFWGILRRQKYLNKVGGSWSVSFCSMACRNNRNLHEKHWFFLSPRMIEFSQEKHILASLTRESIYTRPFLPLFLFLFPFPQLFVAHRNSPLTFCNSYKSVELSGIRLVASSCRRSLATEYRTNVFCLQLVSLLKAIIIYNVPTFW